jgi:hypothetical protein
MTVQVKEHTISLDNNAVCTEHYHYAVQRTRQSNLNRVDDNVV